jgi:hypothetical protein
MVEMVTPVDERSEGAVKFSYWGRRRMVYR